MPGRDKRLRHGHPWVYSNEIRMDDAAKALAPGTIVRLVAAGGSALGCAAFNPHTLIAARLYSQDPEEAIDRGFLGRRLARALGLRQRLYAAPYYRLIHAEADGLPGLVIDRYGSALVVQANAAGIDRLLPDLLAALEDALVPDLVVLRNDSPARRLEGLEAEVRVAKGSLDGPLAVEENGCRFFADPLAGQKTGWFFDQREHRSFVAGLCPGARMLDLYCHTGGFAIQGARAGAAAVLAVDGSQPALDLAGRAAIASGVAERCHFERGDAFATLARLAAAGERFDVVVADPPAFVKSRKDVAAGTRAYRKLTRLAAAVTAPGGFLLIASCSHNVEPARFAEEVARGLQDAQRSGRILRSGGAAPDHPVHPLLPESAYLKVELLQLD
ncbi:MAG: methyltransferase domain-containing protein [Azospirillum sp.]|nr:methyltransferase domain-containing protein [Azospirillum sp.]